MLHRALGRHDHDGEGRPSGAIGRADRRGSHNRAGDHGLQPRPPRATLAPGAGGRRLLQRCPRAHTMSDASVRGSQVDRPRSVRRDHHGGGGRSRRCRLSHGGWRVASPLMEIVLLRHAQPEWNLGREAQVDPDLTELGRQQAELAAQRLATEHFDEVLVSTATRSQATAAPLLERSRPAVIEDRVWLHEIRMPASWQGTPAAEVGRRLRDARERPRDAWWEGMPGGESFRDFHARVTIGLSNELAERGVQRTDDGLWHVPDQPLRMLMIAHAGTNSVVLGHLLGLEPEPWEWERFASDHASLTLLRSVPIAGQHIFTLQSFSDTQHLPPELVSG
jgi:broad specificity phosphatase PhoE